MKGGHTVVPVYLIIELQARADRMTRWFTTLMCAKGASDTPFQQPRSTTGRVSTPLHSTQCYTNVPGPAHT